MGKRTWSELRDDIEQILEDTSNGTFSTAAIDVFMRQGLAELSRYRPLIQRETVTTGSDTYDLDIEDIYDLIGEPEDAIMYAEYKVDKNPRQYRNIIRQENGCIALDLDSYPESSVNVYLYCKKLHRITETDDLAGALTSDYAAGVSTVNVDGLAASGTLPINLGFKIAGDDTLYRLTSATTLSGNAGDFVFTPVLASAASNNDVVTIETSTLTPDLERLFTNLVAAHCGINYTRTLINASNTGGINTAEKLESWGRRKLAEVRRELRGTRKTGWAVRHPTS